MEKGDFLFLLLGASYASFKFAKAYVIDNLPTDFKYNVELNVSNDDPGLKQFDMYPEDNGKILKNLDDKEVMNLLVRNNKVPVWIDIAVESVTNDFTIFRLLCAGRYSNDRKEFYYEKRGSGPFGIKSPVFPIDYKEGIKFKLGNKNVAE
jgi:hypothetical protein